MLSILKEALGGLFKWGMIAIAAIVLFKVIVTFVPALSQDNIKSSLAGDETSEKSKNWFSLPYPGSGAFDLFNIAGGFKYKAVQAPTIDDYIARDTDINNNAVKQNATIDAYEVKTYSPYNDTQNYNGGGRYNNAPGTTVWNQKGTDWNTTQTDWNATQTDWNSNQTDWSAKQTDWSN